MSDDTARGAADPRVRQVAAGLERDLDALVMRAVKRLQEIPEYDRLPEHQLFDSLRVTIRGAIAALQRDGIPNDAELAALRQLAEERAQTGLPVEAFLQRHRTVATGLRDATLEEGRQLGVDAAVLLHLTQAIWDWTDVIMIEAAAAHRRASIDFARREQRARSAILRSLMTGALHGERLVTATETYNLDVDTPYVPFRARVAPALHSGELEASLAGARGGEAVLMAFVEGDLAGLARAIPEHVPAGACVGIGPAAPLHDLALPFALASRAVDVAARFGRSGVFSLEQLALEAVVASEEYLGERLVERYLDPLEPIGDFGAVLRETLTALLRHGLRIEDTAKALFIHPNTLRHRLRRFENETGADLGSTEELFKLWWALQRRAVTGGA